MTRRRGQPSLNNLSPQDAASVTQSPGFLNFPRSASPSTGFTQFLSKPTKWFNRSTSAGNISGRSSTSSMEPRSSTSSRKPKISHPTDPRPILDQLRPDTGGFTAHAGSRSVLDLSLARTTTNFDNQSGLQTPRGPSSPSHRPYASRGLGDLRGISRKPWSKSADDLGKFSQHSAPPLTPIDTALQGKIEHYRGNRTDSMSSSNAPSPSTSPSASTNMSKHYPFPSIPTSDSSSSSPPQRLGVLTGGASLVSGSTSPLTPVPGPVHSRSHSFTPRLPSKLSAGKLGIAPASPKRKGSASSELGLNKEKINKENEREKSISGGSSGSGSSTRPAFPFNFGGSPINKVPPLSNADTNNTVERSASSLGLLAPPMIVEPTADDLDQKSDKRTSQVIFHSGFINRLSDFSPSSMNARAQQSYMSGDGAPSLAKGWKPFKLVLKGSKLYFYKPPGDRGAEIKELFPTELVVVLEDEGLVEGDGEKKEDQAEEGPKGHKGKEKDEGRKRRAYWGRRTHPNLVYGEDIERGTCEALVHEAVFSTTFVTSETDVPEGEQCVARYKPEWQEFSSTVLLCLPSLIGCVAFETEFLRCCTLLVDGAGADLQEQERSRVEWLANQYLSYIGSPTDDKAWEAWRDQTIPHFTRTDSQGSTLSGIPQSTSMQGLYTASPPMNGGEFSPNLGTFSPRPAGDDRMVSLMDALGEPRVVTPSKAPKEVKPWRSALDRGGLSRDVLLSLDAQLVARSLYVFHHRMLKRLPDNITADFCFESEQQDSGDATGVSDIPGGTANSTSLLQPFLGSEERPHWLTKAILLQILISDGPHRTPNTSALGQSLDERNSLTSRTHSRSEVISAWARIGEICRRTGDECSWRAIFAALTCRPIARLDKVWKRVDGDAIRAVQSWVYPHESGDVIDDTEGKTIPWASERVAQIGQSLESARDGDPTEFKVLPLTKARQSFEGLRTELSLCSKLVEHTDSEESDDVEALVAHWESLSEPAGRIIGLASKLNRIEQFMSLSLAAEPRRKGSFEPYFWTRQSQQQGFHPLSPLLFPEPLPTVAFINRALVPRGRVESAASNLNVRDLQYLRELKPLSNDRRTNTESTKMNGLDLGGTMIVLYNGELTLSVQPGGESASPSQPSSRAPSRPPSSVVETPSGLNRNPSMRVKAGSSQGLERKASQLRRNSLPSLSRKPSFVTAEVASDRPLRAVVQAGTLDRLVDILVEGLHGVSVSVADDNGEMPLNNEKTRELRVDMDDYHSVWWSTYRSFVTPNVFFELLRKRYIGAPSKAQCLPGGELSAIVRIRSEIFDTLTKWINNGGGAQDALDDSQLYGSISSFLAHPTDHKLPEIETTADNTSVQQAIAVLDDMRKSLLTSFTAQTLRPSTRMVPSLESNARRSALRTFGPDPPDIDKINVEDLVNNLDAMAAAAFRNVIQEDLFVTSDILGVQSADRTGWFPTREPNSISDEVEIQCMHLYLHDVEPSPLISELGQDSLYRLLPPAIRGCIRAFGILRKWLISKLVALKIGIRARQNRMELVLQAIEVCRLRNTDPGVTEGLPCERPCVRSFVEAILTSAVLSVESRMYHRAWQIVASTRYVPCDTLLALLSKPAISTVSSTEALTTDMGWLLERILEVISMPDVLESASSEGTNLVNFDKLRSLYGLITSAVPSGLPNKHHARFESSRQDFERLNNIEQELNSVHFDLRTIREEAYREAAQTVTSAPLARRTPRPFQALVAAQQDKNKRDKALRDRMSKEKRQEQHRQDKREEYLNKAMHTRRPSPTIPKQHRNKKSMSSAFLHFMRPISSAFTSETASAPMVKRTRAELEFTPAGKPSLVLNVVDARVSQFINTERSYTFQVDTEDGGHYLLQAIDKADMKKWMDTISRVSKIAAQRRLTYLGHNSKMQLSDHLLTPGSVSRDPRAVFGVELDFLLQREADGGQILSGAVPSVIERLIIEVETRGLTEIGIYRVAGAYSEVNGLRDALNRGEWPIDKFTDINAVCDLIKAWFRVLPGGMFPSSHYQEIMDAAAQDNMDLDTRLSNIRRVVHALPDTHFSLLKRLIEHLDKVTDYEEHNQMTAESLATVFSPNLLRSGDNDIGFFFANMSSAHRAIKMLITHFHTVYDDVEHEPDAESDGEEEYEHYEEPIPEEDEEDADILSAGHEMSDEEEDMTQQPVPKSETPTIDLHLPEKSEWFITAS